MTDETFDLITQEYGDHCGLNADWCSCAWLLTPKASANRTNGALYLIHDEDTDEFVLCRQYLNEETGEITTQEQGTLDHEEAIKNFLLCPRWLRDHFSAIKTPSQMIALTLLETVTAINKQ